MSTSSRPPEPAVGRVLVVGPGRALGALGPLLEAYERVEAHTVDVAEREMAPPVGWIRDRARGAKAVVLVADRRRSPRTLVPSVAVEVEDGRRVPVGVVPDLGPDATARFAAAAAGVHHRLPGARAGVALLAQRSGRYRDLAARVRRLLGERSPATPVWWWTADELVRDDMVAGLGTGLAAAVYLGHGRPIGWVGYRGTRAHHLPPPAAPLGCLLSLACLTASRRRTALSFSEALVTRGCAAASLGAVGPTPHTVNARWALGVVRGLAAGAATVGELVLEADPEGGDGPYRIVGDPLAPLRDAPGAEDAAREITEAASLPVPAAAAS